MSVVSSSDKRGMGKVEGHRYDPQAGVNSLEEVHESHRKHGRLSQETVQSSLGKVVDLSAGGMKVICRKVPKDYFRVDIHGLGPTIRVTGIVRWSERIGLMKHICGVEFVGVDVEQARALTRMAMNNRVCPGM